MRYFRTSILRALDRASAVLLVLALLGCAGAGSGTAQLAGAPELPVGTELPSLPWDHPAQRSVLLIQQEDKAGMDTFQASPTATPVGDSMLLNAGEDALSYAIYQFTVGANEAISVDPAYNVTLGANAFVAVSNYARGSWDFIGSFAADPGSFPVGADNVSPGGNLYVLALAWDSTTIMVESCLLTYDDGIDGFDVSGRVVDDGAQPLEGAQLVLNPGGDIAMSDGNGDFVFDTVAPGSYGITVSLGGYVFDPDTQNFEVSDSEVILDDFVGTEDTSGPGISGTIMNGDTPLSGVKVTLIQISGVNTIVDNISTTSGVDGTYSFSGIDEGTWRVAPLLSDFAFTPNIIQLTVDGPEVQDFAAQAVTIPATVTYDDHMRPWLFEPICMNCHHSQYGLGQRNNAAINVNWDTYDGTTELKKLSGNNRVQGNTMPPVFLLPETRTTTFQRQLFQAWADDEFPEN